MISRTEKIASIRAKAVKLAESLNVLAKNHVLPDYSVLNNDELQLFVTLTRKAYDCRDLINVATQELPKSFDWGRLTPSEKDEYEVLLERVENSRTEPLVN